MSEPALGRNPAASPGACATTSTGTEWVLSGSELALASMGKEPSARSWATLLVLVQLGRVDAVERVPSDSRLAGDASLSDYRCAAIASVSRSRQPTDPLLVQGERGGSAVRVLASPRTQASSARAWRLRRLADRVRD